MHAYAVQPSAGFVKLDAMENPLPPAARRCSASWASGWAAVAINRYPAQRTADVRGGAGHATPSCPPAAS